MNNQSIVNSSLQYLRRIFSLAKVPVDVAVVNYQEDKLYKSSNITWDFKFQSSSGLGAERQGKRNIWLISINPEETSDAVACIWTENGRNEPLVTGTDPFSFTWNATTQDD